MLGPQTMWGDVTSLEEIVFIVLNLSCVLHSTDKDFAMFQWISFSTLSSSSSSEKKWLYTGDFIRIRTVQKKQSASGACCSPFQKGPQLHCWTPTSCLVNLMLKHNVLWSFSVAEQDPGSSLALSPAAHSRLLPSIQYSLKKGDEILWLL